MTEVEISVKVKELFQSKNYDEALTLLDFETYNTVLLNQKMSIFIATKDFAKAKEVYDSIKKPDHCSFKYYKILKTEISKEATSLAGTGGGM